MGRNAIFASRWPAGKFQKINPKTQEGAKHQFRSIKPEKTHKFE